MIPLCVAACSGRNSEREQAQALLGAISALDLQAPFEQRGRQIAALQALPLAAAELTQVRDACGKAHAGLLAAERDQATARAQLDVLERGAPPSQAQLAEVSVRVTAAARALQAAHAALPVCETHTREIAVRYR